MQTIALFVNDVAVARRVLAPLARAAAPTRWIVVACPPPLTLHAGRWLAPAARHVRRERFGAELFAALAPGLPGPVETIVAGRSLDAVAAELEARWPGLQCVDARRERIGSNDEPITAARPAHGAPAWAAPAAATAGLSLMLALAD